MSDVRLVATNPEDSSLVPVACNSRGEMMIVEPTIEKISNDVEIEGDLTVTGTINGDTGGSGLPAPGPEGSILAIQEGEPAWVGKSDLCLPPPEPTPDVVVSSPSGQSDPAKAIGTDNTENLAISDFNGWLENLPSWSSPGTELTMGMGRVGKRTASFQFDISNSHGMVLQLEGWVNAVCQSSPGAAQYTITATSRQGDLNPMRTSVSDRATHSNPQFRKPFLFQWLITRGDTTAVIGIDVSGYQLIDHANAGIYFHKFSAIDATEALINQSTQEDSIKRSRNERRRQAQSEVITSMDIDL